MLNGVWPFIAIVSQLHTFIIAQRKKYNVNVKNKNHSFNLIKLFTIVIIYRTLNDCPLLMVC